MFTEQAVSVLLHNVIFILKVPESEISSQYGESNS